MKNASKLSFSELEKELEVVNNEELKSYLGGRWISWGSYDDYVWGFVDEVVVYGGGGNHDYSNFWRGFGGGYNEDYGDYGGGSSGRTGQDPRQNGVPISLPKDKLPQMCTQLTATAECSMYAFNYVSKFFGGNKRGIHMSDFAESIGIDNIGKATVQFFLTDQSGLAKGISNENYNTIASTFFEYKNITSGDVQGIENSLREGNPIIANYGRIDSQNNLNGHAVVIIGYDPNTNEVTIADSLAKNGVRIVRYDSNSFHNQKAIENIKEGQSTAKYRNNKDWWTECNKLGK